MTRALTRRSALLIALLVIVGIAAVVVIAAVLPGGIDWTKTYRPASRAILEGRSPYTVSGYYNAPWAILPFLPFALLPEALGRAFVLCIGFVAFAYVAYRLGAGPASMVVFLLAPSVLHCLLNANIDWLAMLGFVLPPQIGLFFVVTKPQIGMAMVVYWLYAAWREGGVREVVRVYAPFTVVMLLSLALFGLWPLRWENTVGEWWDASFWPGGIPIGLALLVAALTRREEKLAMAASPFLSPHVLLHSWSGALVTLVGRTPEIVAAVAGQWILVIMAATRTP
ncbi:MAG: hypothetical protein M5R40_20865 [Anaerolineae bacterium]|nr:hypothetical protein [Anaerolineae bacterium]